MKYSGWWYTEEDILASGIYSLHIHRNLEHGALKFHSETMPQFKNQQIIIDTTVSILWFADRKKLIYFLPNLRWSIDQAKQFQQRVCEEML